MAAPAIIEKVSLIEKAKKYKILVILFFVLIAGLVTWLAIVQIKKYKQEKLASGGDQKQVDNTSGGQGGGGGAGTPAPKTQTTGKPSASSASSQTTPPPTSNDNFPLSIGSKGDHVKALQYLLNKINPALKLKEDGNFTQAVKNAVLLNIDSKHYPVTATGFLDIVNKSTGSGTGSNGFMGYAGSHQSQRNVYGCSGGSRYVWDGKSWVYVGSNCNHSDSQI